MFLNGREKLADETMSTTRQRGSKGARVQSAARTIDVLQLVAKSGHSGISSKEISAILKVPRQNIYHLVHTLLSVDMLRKASGNNYVLGLGVASLANGFRKQMQSQKILGHYAERAAQLTGETAYMVGWVEGEIVVLASSKGSSPIQAAEISLGTAGEAHARASGKLLLAMADESDLDYYLARHPLTKRTENTLVEIDAFMREIVAIRQSMISFDNEEYALGLRCIAVPLKGPASQFALGISGPAQRITEREAHYVTLLRSIAAE
jgi:DNA-binding IclR family transcriptional regulator